MAVTKDDAAYIAELARLNFTDVELDKITTDLNEILTYMEKLNELDTSSIEELSHPVEFTNVFRADELKPSTPTAEALKNAPSKTEEFFKVPKVISQG
jgi:aspartyl-tRNA(Asn)/glutamyl-tRNA(Gln) amidotransferase subunit C